MKTIHDILKELRACKPALKWAEQYDTIEEIVENVQRGDWLLWLGARLDLPVKELTLAKARCAKTVVHLMKGERSRKAVEVAESFGLGKATIAELNSAYYDAYRDYYDAYNAAEEAYATAACTSYATYDAAAVAAAAAYNAADAVAVNVADYVSNAAADAAYNTAYNAACAAADASDENKKVTADICREVLGNLIIKEINDSL